MKEILPTNKRICLLTFTKIMKSWLNIWCCGPRGIFGVCRVDSCSDFTDISVGNAALHKLIAQNGRTMFRAISEFIGNSALIPNQNSLNDFL